MALEEIPWLQADPWTVAANLLFGKAGPVRPANLPRRALRDQDIVRDEEGLIYWGPRKNDRPFSWTLCGLRLWGGQILGPWSGRADFTTPLTPIHHSCGAVAGHR